MDLFNKVCNTEPLKITFMNQILNYAKLQLRMYVYTVYTDDLHRYSEQTRIIQ